MSKTEENKYSNRNKQLGLKINENLYWDIKKLALEERCCIVEVIEKSVKVFKKQRERERERERESKITRLFVKEERRDENLWKILFPRKLKIIFAI